MKIKILAIPILVFFLAVPVAALSWPDIKELAPGINNDLKSAEKDLESAEWSYRKSFSVYLPQVSANASIRENISATTGAAAKIYSYGLSASQTLFDGMGGIYDIQTAHLNVKYKRAYLQSIKSAVYYDLRKAYVDLLTAQENVKLLGKILSQQKENVRLIKLRYESGKEDKGNLMQTQSDQAQAEYDVASAKRSVTLARLKLTQLLEKEFASVEGKSGVKNPAVENFEDLVKNTPSFVMAESQLKSAETAKNSVLSEFLPSVALSGSYNKSGNSWDSSVSSKSWSLNVSMPIFPGGSNIADIFIKNANLEKAKEDFSGSIKTLRYSVQEAYEAYLDALEALKVADASLAASSEREKISKAKYLNGLADYDEWNRMETAYITAQKNKLSREKSALLAEAAWHKSYGGWVE